MKGNDNTAVLLIHCPDRPGILAVVTEFINQHKGNILYLDQYVNREEKVFFMRVEWDLSTFQIPKDKIEEYFETLIAVRFNMIFRLYFAAMSFRSPANSGFRSNSFIGSDDEGHAPTAR